MSHDDPPKTNSGQFKPGQSGNPNGRKKGLRNLATRAMDAIGDEAAEEILKSAIVAAKGGDMRAAEIILRRAWPERKSRPIEVDIPRIIKAGDVVEALAEITAATAAGEITPDEAEALVKLIEATRKAIESTDLEKRIEALEAKSNETE